MNKVDNYNKHIIISKPFNCYRTYIYRINNFEFITANYLKLIYVVKGSIILELENEVYNFTKGDLFFLGTNMSYKIRQNEGSNTMIILDIKDTYLNKKYKGLFDNMLAPNIIKNKEKIVTNMNLLYKLMLKDESYSDEALILLSKITLSLVNCPMVSNMVNNNGSVRSTIYEISNYIRDNLINICTNNILLSDIADDFNINYYYLSRRFKEIIGLNYSDFILYLKLNIAVDMLINTDYKISEISSKSLFRDPKSFNFSFKNIFKITPTQFRENYKNFHNHIINDSIHKEQSTRDFFCEMQDDINPYSSDCSKLNFNINLLQGLNKQFNLEDNIIDLNNIIDINHGYNLLEDIFDFPFVENVIVKLMIIDRNIYILDKNDNKTLICMHELRHLINVLNKNNCKIYFIFNYQLLNNLKNICSDKILEVLTFISAILGFNHIDENLFGIRFLNFNEYILNNNFDIINSYIEIFVKSLDKIYKNYEYQWFLCIEDIFSNDDLIHIKNLHQSLKLLPNKYLLDYHYSNNYDNYTQAIDYYINLTSMINTILNKSSDKELIVGFNHNITNLFSNDDFTIKYATLFCLSLYINFVLEGYRVAYINYEYMEEKKIMKHNKYTHNALGLISSYYLLTYVLKSLEKNLVISENGFLATCKNDSLTIMIYDNYEKFYEYVNGISFINKDKVINYKLNLFGLKGNYKVIEYTFDLSKDLVKIQSSNLVNISEEDKYLLSLSNKSTLDLNFTHIDGNFTYTTKRNILEVKYIKFQKIY